MKKDVKIILWFAVAAFVAASLVSFAPEDPSLNHVVTVEKVKNYCGYAGSFLSALLLELWGLGAWVFALILFREGYQILEKNSESSKWGWFSSILLLANVSSLMALHLPRVTVYSGQIKLGGALGEHLSSGLQKAFNFAGVAIILWATLFILVSIYYEKSVVSVYDWIKNKWDETDFNFKAFWSSFAKLQLATETGSAKSQKPSKYKSLLDSANPQKAAQLSEKGGSKSLKEKLLSRVEHQDSKAESGLTEHGEIEDSYDDEDGSSDDGELDEGILAGSVDRAAKSQPEIHFAQESGAEEEAPEEGTEEVPSEERRKVRLKTKVQRRIENWKLPDLKLLEDPPATRYRVDEKEMKIRAIILTDKLAQFSVSGEVTAIRPGPAVTLYEFKPRSDVKLSKINELADDLSLALAAESVRIISPIPGRDVVGIETSNANRETVYLKDIVVDDHFWKEDTRLPIALGRQANGTPRVVDLRKMPHLLVAGTTGSGKSVFVVSTLIGLLFKHSPKTLRLILVDPKQVDLTLFSSVPHLLMPVITDSKKAVVSLKWAIKEMDKRYRSMSKFGARGLEAFNEIVEKIEKEKVTEHETINAELMDNNKLNEQYYFQPQPYIVIVVEEFGDLMAVDKVNVEQSVVRLAQMARACGIHLILAMQSPRKDVVTGLIKTNIPGRISFKVASKMDSRIILDDSGAERLLARGDMLFLAPGVAKPERHHGPWLKEEEISKITEFWADQGEPQFEESAMSVINKDNNAASDDSEGGFDEDEQDERYDEILAWVSTMKEVSASLIQRKFRLGYPRAARMIEIFEKEKVVGPSNGSKPRQVLIQSYREL